MFYKMPLSEQSTLAGTKQAVEGSSDVLPSLAFLSLTALTCTLQVLLIGFSRPKQIVTTVPCFFSKSFIHLGPAITN